MKYTLIALLALLACNLPSQVRRTVEAGDGIATKSPYKHIGRGFAAADDPCVQVSGEVYRDGKWRPATCGDWIRILSPMRDVRHVMYMLTTSGGLDLDELAYPQYERKYVITREQWGELRRYCKDRLEKNPAAHPDVIEHWKSIASGKPPFGLRVAN